MKRWLSIAMILGVCSGSAVADTPKRIALTIDDAPSANSPLFTGMQRTQAIIRQLRELQAPPIGVFAIGDHVMACGVDQLNAYGLAGHAICNHTFSHGMLKNWRTESYIHDIARADNLLRNVKGFTPLFRHPYLDEGYPAQSHRVSKALNDMGYTNAYVTVNNFDFYLNSLLQSALKQGKFIDFDKLRTVYLKVMLECVDYYDGLAKLQGRHPMNHVLLMHSTDLTALYIGDLLTALRERGWTIISIHNAYKPVPQGFQNKPALVYDATTQNPATLRNNPQSMSFNYLANLFKEEKVAIDANPLGMYTAHR